MVYMLFDNPADKKKMEFLKAYDETASYELVFPKEKCNSLKKMLVICSNCINCSSRDDIIICWYDFMGIICWWLCKFFHKNRNIVVLNILLKNKKSLRNRVVRFLYKYALKSSELKATVTSKEYGDSINKLLGINKKYVLLYDIYHEEYEVGYVGQIQEQSVFCGGRNGRDWGFLLELAKEMKDIQFNIVISKEQYELYKDSFEENINVKSEISEEEFLKFMCQSSLVLMPLNTEAPAGLIAMFQGSANGKMIITSDTATTREYFGNERGVLCKKDINDWKMQIQYWIGHLEEANERATKMKLFLERECSKKQYSEMLQKIVSE